MVVVNLILIFVYASVCFTLFLCLIYVAKRIQAVFDNLHIKEASFKRIKTFFEVFELIFLIASFGAGFLLFEGSLSQLLVLPKFLYYLISFGIVIASFVLSFYIREWIFRQDKVEKMEVAEAFEYYYGITERGDMKYLKLNHSELFYIKRDDYTYFVEATIPKAYSSDPAYAFRVFRTGKYGTEDVVYNVFPIE